MSNDPLEEEAFILQSVEISEEDFPLDKPQQLSEGEEIKDMGNLEETISDEDEDDLNDYEKLKSKVNLIAQEAQITKTTSKKQEPTPETIVKEEVVEDYIRNYLKARLLNDTLGKFENEYAQKHIKKEGEIIPQDVYEANSQIAEKTASLTSAVEENKTKLNEAKSTFDILRKERDFHKFHYQRVQNEKKTLNENIKQIKQLHSDFEERIEALNKKYEATIKEKTLIKLERDKTQNQANQLKRQIKELEDKVTKDAKRKKSPVKSRDKKLKIEGTFTKWPEEARPNPNLSKNFELINGQPVCLKTINAHEKPIASLALHNRKAALATVSDDCSWKIWNVTNGELLMSAEGHKDFVSSADFHPAGSHMATGGGDCLVKLWDFEQSCCIHTFQGNKEAVWAVKFHDTGQFLLTCSMDSSIKLYDLGALKCRMTFRDHTDSVNKVNFQPYTNYFVSGSSDKTVSIWDMRSGLTVQTFYGHLNSVNDAIFSCKGALVGSCDADGIVKVWDIRTVKEVKQFNTGNKSVSSICFDKNEKFIIAGIKDGNLKMLNLESDSIDSIPAHDKGVTALITSHTNSEIYTVGDDGKLKIWK